MTDLKIWLAAAKELDSDWLREAEATRQLDSHANVADFISRSPS